MVAGNCDICDGTGEPVFILLKHIFNENLLSVRCHKDDEIMLLAGVFALFTGIECEQIRLCHNSTRLDMTKTIGEVGIQDKDVIHVFQVLQIIDYPDGAQQWVCSGN